MSEKKIIAYRLSPIYGGGIGIAERIPIATAALMQCMVTGETLSGHGGGGLFLAPEVVEDMRKGKVLVDKTVIEWIKAVAETAEAPGADPKAFMELVGKGARHVADTTKAPDSTALCRHGSPVGQCPQQLSRGCPDEPPSNKTSAPIMLQIAKASDEHEKWEKRWRWLMKTALPGQHHFVEHRQVTTFTESQSETVPWTLGDLLEYVGQACGFTREGECPACGGTKRMGPYFPGGLSTECGNCK